MKKSNMSDVAKLAGVSVATVSHVISKKRYVSDEITQKVNQAIAQLAYTPNVMARNLKTGKSNAILFIVADIGNSFFSTAVEEVEAVLSDQGYRLLIANTKEDITRETKQLREVNSSIVDGIILASTAESQTQLEQILPADIPIVLFDRSFDKMALSSVECDSSAQLSAAICALNEAGHHRIGFIFSHRRLSSAQKRLGAYSCTMEHFGLSNTDCFVKECMDDYAKVETACVQLLKEGVTAIIASDGAMSFFTRHACMQMGKVLGRDIEIVGYVDAPNTNMMSDYFATINLPIQEAARRAGEEILHCIQHQNSFHKIALHASLSFRQNCAKQENEPLEPSL